MFKFVLLSAIVVSIFAGCSAKEFNEGVDSITNDISTKFEEGKDNAQD